MIQATLKSGAKLIEIFGVKQHFVKMREESLGIYGTTTQSECCNLSFPCIFPMIPLRLYSP